jgi:hypothetical protein
MKIAIATDQKNKNIIAIKEYEPIYSKGEVAHFLAELESIKKDLLEIWESEEVQEMEE